MTISIQADDRDAQQPPSGGVNVIPPEIQRIFDAKERRRHELAALPWEEKVRMIIEMQHMLAPILRARGIDVTPWPRDGK